MLAQSIPRPGFVPTMQPTLVDAAPEGDDWIHEIKHDGYRTELVLNGDESRAFTRNGHDWSDKYRLILDAAANCQVRRRCSTAKSSFRVRRVFPNSMLSGVPSRLHRIGWSSMPSTC